MTVYSWANAASGDWGTGTLWTPQGPPNALTADATIGVTGTYTVTIGATEAFSVDSLTMTDAAASLDLLGTLTLGGATATLDLDAGTITEDGLISGGTIAVAGGTLDIAKSLTYAGSFAAHSGVVSVAASDTLKLTGAVNFDTINAYGPSIEGPGTISTTGATTLATQTQGYIDLYLGDGASWVNSGSVAVGGIIDFGLAPADHAAFVNQAGGVFNFTDDLAEITAYTSYDSATFSNAGLLEKTAGTATSAVGAVVTNTGTIAVASGTISFLDGGTFGGSLTGAGTIAFAGGTSKLTATTTTANILLNGGTIAIAANETVTGPFTGASGVVTIAAGKILTLANASTFATTNAYGPTVEGPGTLITDGATTLASQTQGYVDLYLGDGGTWANSGTVTVGGQIDFGLTGADKAAFVNHAGAVFDLVDDLAGLITYTSYDTATFTNAGLLEKTAGTATSTIDATVTNTGSIVVASGTIAFDGGGTFGGSLTGAGTLAFGGGISTLSATTTTTNFLVNGGTLSLAANESVAGTFQATTGLVTIASAVTLKLLGATTFGTTNAYGPTVTGPGTLSTTGTTTLASQTAGYIDLIFGGGGTWINSGTVNAGGQIEFGDTANDHAAFINQTGGVFDLTDDYGSILPYTSYDTATFTNAGLLEKTAGTNTSAIYATVTNTGSISVASGTMAFFAGGTFGGTITGAGTLAFSGGTSSLTATTTTANLLVNGGTLNASTKEAVANLAISSGTLGILNAASISVSGSFTGTGGVVTIATAAALDLTGAASFDTINAYGPSIEGPGTLSTAGATTLATQTQGYVDLYLAGAGTWTNSGAVSVGGQIDFGVTAADSATFINQAGGVFNLTDDLASILAYTSYDTATFTNAGLLEKSGGTATSTIDAAVINTGSILVSSGTIAFAGGGTLGGSLTGAGTLAFSGGTTKLTATTTANILVNGGTLAIAANESIASSVSATNGLVSLASSTTLKLSGATSFDTTNAYGPSISGPGTLSTVGPTTLATQTAAYVDLYFGGGGTWINSGSVTIGGQIAFGLAPADSAIFVNQAGGVFDFTNDIADLVPNTSYDTATFSNAGLLEKTGGTATSAVYATVTNSGTILVTSGTMGFFSGGTFGGTLAGAGTIAFISGTNTLTATSTTANILLNGGTLSVAGNETIAGPFTATGGLITAGSGETLKLAGQATFDNVNAFGPSVEGPGTLSTSGATTLATQSGAYVDLYVGDGATWSNSGSATIGGQVDFGLVPADTAAFVNLAGGVFDLTGPYSSLVPYSSYDSATFHNAGLLEDTGGTGTNVIDPTLTNTGTVIVTSGTLSLPVLTNLSGTTLTGGTYEATAGAALQLANNVTIATAAATIILNGTGSAVQSLNTTTSTEVAVDSTLYATTAAGGLEVLGGRNFTVVANSGKFVDNGLLQLGGGTFTASTLSVGTGAKLLGFGTVTNAVASTGLLDANGGLLLFSAAVAGPSLLEADAGATLQLGANAAPATDSTTITLNGAGSEIEWGNGTPTKIESSLTGIAAGATFAVLGGRGYTTTLGLSDSGILQLGGGTFSAGSLAVRAGGTLVGFGTVTPAVANGGTVEASGTGDVLKLSKGAAGAGALIAGSGATLELAGATTSGAVTDNGTLTLDGITLKPTSVTVGSGALVTGSGTISGAVTNGGTIDASAGTLTVTGAVTGTGSLLIGAGETLALGSSAAATQTAVFASTTGTLSLAAPASFAGSITGFTGNDLIYLGGQVATGLAYNTTTHVLTVTGASGTIAALTFNGTYTQGSFALANGGKDITDPPVKLTTKSLGAAPEARFISSDAADTPAGTSATLGTLIDTPAALAGTAWFKALSPAGGGTLFSGPSDHGVGSMMAAWDNPHAPMPGFLAPHGS
jgi:fibronectin-binding autotransporter adhesin